LVRRWTTLVLSIFSVVISSIALYSSCKSNDIAREANLEADTANAIARRADRRQKKLNKPVLEVDFRESLPSRFRYSTGWLLSVKGGPATVKWAKLLVDSSKTSTWQAAIESLPIDPEPSGWIRHVPIEGDRFDPGDQVVLFAVEKQLGSLLSEYRHRVDLSICYCSIFGECWVEFTGAPPQPKDGCGKSPENVLRSARPEPQLEIETWNIYPDYSGTIQLRLSNEYGEEYYDPDLKVGYYLTSSIAGEASKRTYCASGRDEEGYPALCAISAPSFRPSTKYYFVAKVYSKESDFTHHVISGSLYVSRE
jgi:hypothetical protein